MNIKIKHKIIDVVCATSIALIGISTGRDEMKNSICQQAAAVHVDGKILTCNK